MESWSQRISGDIIAPHWPIAVPARLHLYLQHWREVGLQLWMFWSPSAVSWDVSHAACRLSHTNLYSGRSLLAGPQPISVLVTAHTSAAQGRDHHMWGKGHRSSAFPNCIPGRMSHTMLPSPIPEPSYCAQWGVRAMCTSATYWGRPL